jgi:AcrR family transcriptional regulator
VAANQKARLYRAMIETLAGEGYEALTVRGLYRAAGVSSSTFYRHFDNLEDCLADAYAAIMSRTLRRARAARDLAGGGEPGVRAALRSVLCDAAEDPAAGAAALLGAYGAGPGMLLRVQAVAEGFERFAAETLASRGLVPREFLTATVAAATRVIRSRVLAGRQEELSACADPLADWVLAICAPAGRVVTFLEGALVSRAAVWPAGPRPHEPWADTGDEERDRLLAAVVTLAAERPYCELTAAAIRAEARVTRRSFDAHFDGVGDCFLVAARSMILAAARRAEGQAKLAASWEGGLYRAAFMLLLEIGRTPELAKLGFVELFEPGRDGMRCRSELISIGARRLRETSPPSRRPGELAAEATMAAACQLVDQRLAAGDPETLPRLAPLIAYLSLAPVLGADAALAAIRAEQEHLFGPLPSATPKSARRSIR